MRARRRIVEVAVLPTSVPLSNIDPVSRSRIFQDDPSRNRQLRDQTLRIGQIEGDSKRESPLTGPIDDETVVGLGSMELARGIVLSEVRPDGWLSQAGNKGEK